MFKRIFSLVLVLALTLSLSLAFTACGDDAEGPDGDETVQVKLGVILLHDEDSTYDLNFIQAVNRAKEQLGLSNDEVILMRNIPETNACYEAAADLVDQGCNIIFADSFGHETYMIKAAREFKDVQFCHATGTMAHTENLPNYHNAFASIYEGRYLAGIAAGMKLNELKTAGKLKGEVPKMGYVGAFTYAEVISGYTSFYLGEKSVCPDVIMEVQFTGSWYSENFERSAATALINNGCDLISQHADSMGAPSVCEDMGIPNVSYNGSTVANCPETFIVSSKIDWTPYFVYICNQVKGGKAIDVDWTGTIETGSVVLTDVNTAAAAAGTVEAIEAARQALINGTVHVFDTNTFTINNGQKLADNFKADVDTDEAYTADTDVVDGGYFHESEFRSAPYFDLRIDGIKLLNEVYDPIPEEE